MNMNQNKEGGEKMLLMICFNLKSGVSEAEFVKLQKEFSDYVEGKVEGFGTVKLYRHQAGANPRYYQMHLDMKDYVAWDRFVNFIEKDAKAERLVQEWRRLVDLNTHFDEFVREIPL